MLRNDHYNYNWFCALPDASADNAARAIIDWRSAFGVPIGLTLDGPKHFMNETTCLVLQGLHAPRHFTLPYSAWSTEAVERLGIEPLRVFRSVASELQIRPEEWPDDFSLVQSTPNFSPFAATRKHLPGYCFYWFGCYSNYFNFLWNDNL